MKGSPFELIDSYETAKALDTLSAIGRGRAVAPSEAAMAAEMIRRHPNKYSAILGGSENNMDELRDALLSPAERLFGYEMTSGASENG